MRNWLLPDNIQDVLPPEARRIEVLRSNLLELFRVHGYLFVMPPMLEYVESLLTGTGEDLDLRTFKLVDQSSGRMMGVRADITPQVARIDAHLLNREGVARLCYCGSVLHTQVRGQGATREPIQIGAEIYGHAGIESDLEIQDLLFKALVGAGCVDARIDLGHVAVFRALCRHAKIGNELEIELQAALETKDSPGLSKLTASLGGEIADALRVLPHLYGDTKVLDEAARRLPDLPEIREAIKDLRRLSSDTRYTVSIDLADLRGYHYHSGVVFAAYAPGRASAIALGGRYDEVGRAFGRARPATGFSMDLMTFSSIALVSTERKAILCPLVEDSALVEFVQGLRTAGEIVIVDLPGHKPSRDELGCDREILLESGAWRVRQLH